MCSHLNGKSLLHYSTQRLNVDLVVFFLFFFEKKASAHREGEVSAASVRLLPSLIVSQTFLRVAEETVQ